MEWQIVLFFSISAWHYLYCINYLNIDTLGLVIGFESTKNVSKSGRKMNQIRKKNLDKG
jgi:hypothetical protein